MTSSLINDLLYLLYPECCAACGRRLKQQEAVICLHCEYDLPRTNHHLESDNELAKKFWGRIELQYAFAYLIFNKGERVQRLIHRLKYEGYQNVGHKMGMMLGTALLTVKAYRNCFDIVLPIPLHPKKKAQRGYNQSDSIAEGLANSLGISWSNKHIVRNVYTKSQTKKSRYERWENVANVFSVPEQYQESLVNKHILLVDDVITTGATIEACAQTLLHLNSTKVSVACLATA